MGKPNTIPKDDIECWIRYPKHRWTYDMSRLLDAQGVEWSIFETESCKHKEQNTSLNTSDLVKYDSGYIFISTDIAATVDAEAYVISGDIKYLNSLDLLSGELELKIHAFISLYFQKFTGVVSFKTHSKSIYRICLRPTMESNDASVLKLVNRIYAK